MTTLAEQDFSARDVARTLGTSVPRVLRAARRLRIDAAFASRGAPSRFTREDTAALRAKLGGPVPGELTRVQAKVFKALAISPLGLWSVRAVSRRAGTSPSATKSSLIALRDKELVRFDTEHVFLGHVKDITVYRMNHGNPSCGKLLSQLSGLRFPEQQEPEAKKVPYYLRYLFWNTAEEQLYVDTSAEYIARRLLTSKDMRGIAWGAAHLPPLAWEYAASSRNLESKDKAMAQNLARRTR